MFGSDFERIKCMFENDFEIVTITLKYAFN